jgi:DNA-binding IclR family transcriptional regulator
MIAVVRDDAENRRPTARTVAVLEAFTLQTRWGVRELAAKLDMPRSSVHRVLRELAETGLLASDADGSYGVTPSLLRLALDLADNFRVPRIALAHLERARDIGGETTIMFLYDRRRGQATAVAAAESSKPVRYSQEGLTGFTDLHVGSSGKGILAFLSAEEQNLILERLPDPLPGMHMTKQELLADLAATRERGWAQSASERVPGARGVAAPVYGSRGYIIGAVLIAWPDSPVGSDGATTLGPLSRVTALAISRDVGCPPDQLAQLGQPASDPRAG